LGELFLKQQISFLENHGKLSHERNLAPKIIPIDWIREMDNYFDYEDVEEEKKVRHVVTRLKGHKKLWWDELHADRRRKVKKKIKSWDRMVAKLKVKFMPKDYQINLFRRMQNLRQRGLFKTTCKMKDTVCKLIIDSRSTYNLVSREMVDNLELDTTTQPTP
jgi:hypothetical protein